jgi:hypothetical protein
MSTIGEKLQAGVYLSVAMISMLVGTISCSSLALAVRAARAVMVAVLELIPKLSPGTLQPKVNDAI